MKNKIKIGVSSCLLGEKVRWNGDHKQDRYVRDTLGKYFEYIPTCPEVEVGMGTPRETVALYGTLENPRMIGRNNIKNYRRSPESSPQKNKKSRKTPEGIKRLFVMASLASRSS